MGDPMKPILIVPGYQGSGPGHWQSLWEDDMSDALRVEMPSWEQPDPKDWIVALDEAIAACKESPILVGHALGCIAIAHWAVFHARTVHGALLVAPEDVEHRDCLALLRPFAPIPRRTLPFPSILAASSDDPFMTVRRARGIATDWGAQFVELGPCGRLDQASGHGPWPRGEALLAELR